MEMQFNPPVGMRSHDNDRRRFPLHPFINPEHVNWIAEIKLDHRSSPGRHRVDDGGATYPDLTLYVEPNETFQSRSRTGESYIDHGSASLSFSRAQRP